jgi:hypothetical protein
MTCRYGSPDLARPAARGTRSGTTEQITHKAIGRLQTELQTTSRGTFSIEAMTISRLDTADRITLVVGVTG